MGMLQGGDQRRGFRIPDVKLEEDKKGLVGQAGLQAVLQIFDSTDLGRELAACLPEDGSNRSFGNYQLGLLLIASLMTGHDCIDDIDKFVDDDLVEHLFGGKLPTPKTMGNFLRRFEENHIEKLKLFLTKMGYTLRDHSMRVHSHKGEVIPHFKIDGTPHEQHGRQMEGCGWMKTSRDKSVYGYASQTVFDELGFCFAGELLPASKPKGNPADLLDQVLSPLKGKKIDNPFEKVVRVSGDSAYLAQDNIRCVQNHHAIFTFAAPRTIQWERDMEQREWVPWVYSEEQVAKLGKRKKELPECFVSRWHWTPGWSKEVLKFPVVIKKEWRSD